MVSLAAASTRLRAVVLDTLRPILGAPERCALIDFPNYANVGDSAIYLGELACLSALGVPTPRFVCDLSTYDRSALARRVGGGPILLAGGGNFGDVWPLVQRLREQIIRAFPNNRIIQLPQTVHFETEEALCRARKVTAAHPDFTLMVRDHRSLDIARRDLGVNAVLCPDMAFCLGPLARRTASQDVVWLSRTDAESAFPDASVDVDQPTVDWLEERQTPLHTINRWLSKAVGSRVLERHVRPLLRATYAPLARLRLRRGVRLLSTGRVVITDRLHGHILSLLLGIPHVLLDNAYGKLSHFHATWSQEVDGVQWAESRVRAIALAREAARFVAARDREGRMGKGGG